MSIINLKLTKHTRVVLHIHFMIWRQEGDYQCY